MDLVNLMYKYINRLINSDELLGKMNSLDFSNYSIKERKTIEKLVKDIKDVKTSVPNEIDEVEKNRLKTIDKLISGIDEIFRKNTLDSNLQKSLEKRKSDLLEDRKKVKDGGKLYKEIFTLLTQNDLIANYCEKMNDLELLEFIVQYISVPLPPKIDQDDFNELALIAISKDEREWLWRLAFNYNRKNKDFSLIEDYFIETRDDYYLTELICAVEEDLNMKALKKKVLATKDNDFITKVENTLETYSIKF